MWFECELAIQLRIISLILIFEVGQRKKREEAGIRRELVKPDPSLMETTMSFDSVGGGKLKVEMKTKRFWILNSKYQIVYGLYRLVQDEYYY
jgi:hypothetical protein